MGSAGSAAQALLVGEVDIAFELMGRHPFGPIARDRELMHPVGGGDDDSVVAARLVQQSGADPFDIGIGGLAKVGVVDGKAIRDDLLDAGRWHPMGIKHQMRIQPLAGAVVGQNFNQFAAGRIKAILLFQLHQQGPCANHVIAIDQ